MKTTRQLSIVAGLALSFGVSQARPDEPVRRVTGDDTPTVLAFKNVSVEQLLPFIVEATGKVVMPQPDVLNRKVTVWNDQPIPRDEALNYVFLTLQQAGIGVVETDKTVSLRDISEIDRQDVAVIPGSVSVLGRTDLGTMAEKVYTLYYSTAEEMGKLLKDSIPSYAKMTVDKESNQIAVLGNIALLQRIERKVKSLDQQEPGAIISETFLLRYADATQIKTNIEELYADTNASRNAANANNRNRGFVFPGQQQQEESAAPSANLRVTANTQQNAVTVSGEPGVIAEIRRQITEFWDKPLPPDSVIPKVYDLRFTDAIEMKALLEQMFGQETTSAGGGGGGGNRGGQQGNQPQAGLGAGRLAGQFSFQAMPSANRLLVIAKSPDNLAAMDEIIAQLDAPSDAGLPAIVELKHASAEELAEQLNSLLALEGTLAQIPRSESGLSEGAGASASPFAQDQQTNQNQQDQTSPESITFWWQRSSPPSDDAGVSNLVGQIRIVPVWRQNALMVLAPVEYKNAVVRLIGDLDRPGRQVLLRAIIAEISSDDATAFGLRWSNTTINPTNQDNIIAIGTNTTGTENNVLGSLFDTSVLTANMDLNLLLQALNEKARVNILSEPRIFTSDNQEAEFFDGQDIPFITESQPNNQGNLLQSFDYRAVGIQLRVRPRITVKREVDLRVNLELSSIVPGETLFGGFIVDRRETTTQLILKDGQTVVISGIFRSEVSDIVRKVPLLGDIPLIGWLFKSIDKQKTNSELVVFITPFVVDNTDETDDLNQNDLEWLQRQRDDHKAPPVPDRGGDEVPSEPQEGDPSPGGG